jgi:hypothetical protein
MDRCSRRSIVVTSVAALASVALGGRRASGQGASPAITVYRNPT